MKYVIWGGGARGRCLAYHLGNDLVAFIDSDVRKQGGECEGVEVISFDEYLLKYKDATIVVSTDEEEISRFLRERDIYHYYLRLENPEDFLSSNPRDILKKHIQENVVVDAQYGIYGDTLFSNLLYSWLVECKLKYKPYYIVDDVNEKVEHLRREYGEYLLCQTDMENKNIDIILGASYIVPQSFQKEDKYHNIWRLSEKIPQYRNPKIEAFKERHKGKRCFVVATGPSLTVEDLDILDQNHEICISMNEIYNIFQDTHWRPDYWCAIDSGYIQSCIEEIKNNLPTTTVFLADGVKGYEKICSKENMYWYHLGRQWDTKATIPFSVDFAQIAYAEGTVIYACLQLAVYLGFKEIYLLGADATGINKKNEKYEHFFDEEKLVSICWSEQVLNSYLSARKYANENDIRIYNATRGGELEVFERVDYDSLFS